MNGLRRRILNHALKNRRNPSYNRRRVGKNLSVLTVFVFFVFLINFAIIIGTGKKFGVLTTELIEMRDLMLSHHVLEVGS